MTKLKEIGLKIAINVCPWLVVNSQINVHTRMAKLTGNKFPNFSPSTIYIELPNSQHTPGDQNPACTRLLVFLERKIKFLQHFVILFVFFYHHVQSSK